MLQPYNIQPKHLIAADNVIFGYHEGQLKLLLFQRNLEPCIGKWSLVGGWVNADESVENAANRVLEKYTGLKNIFMEQVRVFSKPDRDSGGRVLSVVFYTLIKIDKYDHQLVDKYQASWWPVNKLPELIFDHHEMVQIALEKLRNKASYDLVGRDLLSEEFTITQLRNLYNSIFMREFDPGNFRKKVLSLNAMIRMDRKDTSESKKGAYYYTFKNIEDIDASIRIIKI